ncbi:hypothetical protein HanHA300_Chr00c0730g0807811 [Helianthus annuus]|nr:hypothetical protein HanIR_Chr02g0058881 [Helianthus annuus]KAJ0617779.1 hypothetical protein HanHA89_Chr02g0045691 [Helianthus annuus]KAJ0625241.1 hypothetical protein HanHA300_Chr00c0730g0807811 [Helianthus annuus]KAJ0950713.1 hypothetical protein HanPSC8_Chr02g0051461 [Helianthus annuus]
MAVVIMLIRFSQALVWVFGSSSEMVILFQVRVVFESRFQRFTLQISFGFGFMFGPDDGFRPAGQNRVAGFRVNSVNTRPKRVNSVWVQVN